MGRARRWGNKFRLMHRAHGWAMDIFIIGWRVSSQLFMSHGVKAVDVADQFVFAVS